MLLSKHKTQPQWSQLPEPLWADPGLKRRISISKLISKMKKSADREWMVNILPNSLQTRKGPPLPYSLLFSKRCEHVLWVWFFSSFSVPYKLTFHYWHCFVRGPCQSVCISNTPIHQNFNLKDCGCQRVMPSAVGRLLWNKMQKWGERKIRRWFIMQKQFCYCQVQLSPMR